MGVKISQYVPGLTLFLLKTIMLYRFIIENTSIFTGARILFNAAVMERTIVGSITQLIWPPLV